jgi:DNA primase
MSDTENINLEQAKQEAMVFLKHPRLKENIIADITRLGYVGEDANKFLLYLVATSRNMNEPLGCIVRASSSTGKTILVDTVAKLIPECQKKVLTRVTKQSLFYEKDLSHKFVYIKESVGCEEAAYAIRILLSEKELVLNRLIGATADEIVVCGPIAYVETTADGDIEQQKANRVFEIWLDESEETTANIQRFQREKYTLGGLERKRHSQELIIKHHLAQMMLKPIPVVIPYAESIEFPCKLVRHRRDQERFLNLICASTFLHQYQRDHNQINGIEYIEATLGDYEIAYELMEPVLLKTLNGHGEKPLELLRGIIGMVKARSEGEEKRLREITFTRRDIEEYLGWSEKQIKDHIRKLENNAIKVINGRRGVECKYSLICDSTDGLRVSGLLRREKLEAKIKMGKCPK